MIYDEDALSDERASQPYERVKVDLLYLLKLTGLYPSFLAVSGIL